MVKEYRIHEGQLAACEEMTGNIRIFINPDVVERNALENQFQISPHNISSALDPDEIGRLEFEEDHVMLILKNPKNYSSSDNFLFKVTSLGLFLFKNQLIIIVNNAETSILEGRQNIKIHTLHDVVLKVLNGTISHFLGHLKVISLLSDSLEQKISTSMENEHLLNMFTIEKSLIYYLNGINSNSVVIEKLKLSAAKIGFSEDNVALLDDIMIENNQCNKQAEIYSNILTGLNDARGSIVNNNMNQLIKKLTILSVVFMPLNVVAGVGGMSEFSSWTGNLPWPVAYGLLAIGLCGIAVATYFILRLFIDKDPKKKGKK